MRWRLDPVCGFSLWGCSLSFLIHLLTRWIKCGFDCNCLLIEIRKSPIHSSKSREALEFKFSLNFRSIFKISLVKADIEGRSNECNEPLGMEY
jgi:hypothetical protein